MNSPTQRTLKYLRSIGYVAQVVEKFNYFSKTRQDLFGVIDIVAIRQGCKGVLGVQTTSMANVSSRVKKSLESSLLPLWLECGNRFKVIGWGKQGKAGKRKVYNYRILEAILHSGVGISFEEIDLTRRL